MRGRHAEVVSLCCAACVVMVLLASTTRGVARAGAAAAGAADEASQQIPAIILPVAVPRVLPRTAIARSWRSGSSTAGTHCSITSFARVRGMLLRTSPKRRSKKFMPCITLVQLSLLVAA
jgi:hypothetical protein